MSFELTCAITKDPLVDPVISPGGHTYSRKNILEWIKKNPTSPFTRLPLKEEDLRPNRLVQNLLDNIKNKVKNEVKIEWKVGDIVEARDWIDDWRYALIKNKNGRKYSIHFLGWNSQLDRVYSDREMIDDIRPLGTNDQNKLSIQVEETLSQNSQYEGDEKILNRLRNNGMINTHPYQIGDVVEACNHDGYWSYGIVTVKQGNSFRIHFLGRYPGLDEWFPSKRMETDVLPLKSRYPYIFSSWIKKTIKDKGIYEGDSDIIAKLREEGILGKAPVEKSENKEIKWNEGDIVEACDKNGKWCYALIQKNNIVHFLGYHKEHDEVFDLKRMKTDIFPLGVGVAVLDRFSRSSIDDGGRYKGDKKIIDFLKWNGILKENKKEFEWKIGDVVEAYDCEKEKKWCYALIKNKFYSESLYTVYFMNKGEITFDIDEMKEYVAPLNSRRVNPYEYDDPKGEDDKKIVDGLIEAGIIEKDGDDFRLCKELKEEWKTGDVVIACDRRDKWYYAYVGEKYRDSYDIHFLGWDPEQNELFDSTKMKTHIKPFNVGSLSLINDRTKDTISNNGIYIGDKEIIDVLKKSGKLDSIFANANANLKVGTIIEARYGMFAKNWCYGIVKNKLNNKMRIHLLGWKHDVWFGPVGIEQNTRPLGFDGYNNNIGQLAREAIEAIEQDGLYDGDKEIIDILRQKNVIESPKISIEEENKTKKTWEIDNVFEARDRTGEWHYAVSKGKEGSQTKVHFLGWNSGHDEWFGPIGMKYNTRPLGYGEGLELDMHAKDTIDQGGIYEGDNEIIEAIKDMDYN